MALRNIICLPLYEQESHYGKIYVVTEVHDGMPELSAGDVRRVGFQDKDGKPVEIDVHIVSVRTVELPESLVIVAPKLREDPKVPGIIQ